MFQAGDADYIDVPRAYVSQLEPLLAEEVIYGAAVSYQPLYDIAAGEKLLVHPAESTDFHAEGKFTCWWTKDGEQIGDKFPCEKIDFDLRHLEWILAEKPAAANDFHFEGEGRCWWTKDGEMLGTEFPCTKIDFKLSNPAGIARVYRPLTTVSAADGFFNFDINVEGGNPYIGSGQLDGNGIPPNFFTDADIRKGINYCFDWGRYIEEVYLGEAEQRKGPIINGIFGYNPDQPTYSHDVEKAEGHFKAAWGGQAWGNGVRFTITYNVGNLMRKAAAEMIEACMEDLNPKFNVEVLDLPWPTYLKEMDADRLAMFFIGWLEDYHHPHNWVQPYMHRVGAFGENQNFHAVKDVSFTPKYATFLPSKTYATLQDLFDELIEMARKELDLNKAKLLYYELQNLAYEYAIDLFMVQPIGRHYEQLWVKGWFYNPAYPGDYFWWLSKG